MDAFGVHRMYRAGETIIREGDAGEEMYVVRAGKVRVFKGREIDASTLAIVGPGEYIGEMALMADFPRTASATAETDVEVTVIDRPTFRGHVTDPMILNIMRTMAERIRELDDEVAESRRVDDSRREQLGSIIEQRHWFV